MNRTGLGLAVGAGYLLGRTKKLKMAFAVGRLVAGKKLNLSPRMVADLVQQQLQNNPQFKEIGDQLREDLRGVGKAASGAMVERQLDAFADRLHGRTAQVRDQLRVRCPAGARTTAEEEEYAEDEEPEGEEPEDLSRRRTRSRSRRRRRPPPRRHPPKKTAEEGPGQEGPGQEGPRQEDGGPERGGEEDHGREEGDRREPWR